MLYHIIHTLFQWWFIKGIFKLKYYGVYIMAWKTYIILYSLNNKKISFSIKK